MAYNGTPFGDVYGSEFDCEQYRTITVKKVNLTMQVLNSKFLLVVGDLATPLCRLYTKPVAMEVSLRVSAFIRSLNVYVFTGMDTDSRLVGCAVVSVDVGHSREEKSIPTEICLGTGIGMIQMDIGTLRDDTKLDEIDPFTIPDTPESMGSRVAPLVVTNEEDLETLRQRGETLYVRRNNMLQDRSITEPSV